MLNFDAVFNTANFEKDLITEAQYNKFKEAFEFDVIDVQSSSQRSYVSDVKSEQRNIKELESIDELKDEKIGLEAILANTTPGTEKYTLIEQDIASVNQKIIDKELKFAKSSPLYPNYQGDYKVFINQQVAEGLQASYDALIVFGQSKGWEV